MLKIVIPMAGAGARFAAAGYKEPKPLIPVRGIPMIRLIINNLRPLQPHCFIFICQNDHIRTHDLYRKLSEWAPGSEIVTISGLTEGAACSVLAAREHIDSQGPLMIANSDQYVDTSINLYLKEVTDRNLDGMIMTMKANDPKWSFVGFHSDGLVARVVEKEVISNDATVGIYNFRKGSDFVHAAEKMIAADDRTNNEFYVAPAYNYLIASGARIGAHDIGREGSGMYGLGTPDDLNNFLGSPASRRATAGLG